MHILDSVLTENTIGYFPSFENKLVHGFSWGAHWGNMAYEFGKPVDVLKENKRFYDALSLGKLKDSVVLIPEHSTNVVDLNSTLYESIPVKAIGRQIKGDVVFTTMKGVTLSVKPGDCTTAIIYAKTLEGTVVGLAHTGWRSVDQGLPKMIVEHLVRSYSVNVVDIYLGVVPHILKENRTYEHLDGFTQSDKWDDFFSFDDNVYHFDEGGCALYQYQQAGVPSGNIEVYEVDNYIAAERGESYSQKLAYNQNRDGLVSNDGRFIVAARL